uniref:Uncharacterized protein n=2 Tax=Palpitomonas bilix TaxID=652834 RepID=A0A7S3GJK1_9EUKA|mmetsp:Transcript_6045/g.14686  ORF Transcript_6045/g.14686 Transcript_6045/m.14686 type:complete len:305 (+) Transcript_6045:204-1118(+)
MRVSLAFISLPSALSLSRHRHYLQQWASQLRSAVVSDLSLPRGLDTPDRDLLALQRRQSHIQLVCSSYLPFLDDYSKELFDTGFERADVPLPLASAPALPLFHLSHTPADRPSTPFSCPLPHTNADMNMGSPIFVAFLPPFYHHFRMSLNYVLRTLIQQRTKHAVEWPAYWVEHMLRAGKGDVLRTLEDWVAGLPVDENVYYDELLVCEGEGNMSRVQQVTEEGAGGVKEKGDQHAPWGKRKRTMHAAQREHANSTVQTSPFWVDKQTRLLHAFTEGEDLPQCQRQVMEYALQHGYRNELQRFE